MNRADFQALSERHRRDARLLLDARRFAGAYYLAGYAVECALKACICRQIARYDFPDRRLSQQAHTHDLEVLVRVAGLAKSLADDAAAHRALALNWAVVKDEITIAQAQDLYDACVQRRAGILTWLQSRW